MKMSEHTKTCEELISKGKDDPCITEVQTDVKWMKNSLEEFKEYYVKAHDELIKTNNEAHKEIIRRQDTTNGHIAEVKIWKERITGATILLTALGLISWLGKYVISYLEK